MRDPNLFILGAQKAGTTYLAQALAGHRDVFFTDPKEPMFFSRRGTRTPADYEDYLERHFAGSEGTRWRAEGSTTYLQWIEARDRLRALVPGHPRFIVCLRQPTAKAISFFVHNWRRDRYAAGTRLSDTLDADVTLSPLRTSLYAEAIARWQDAYPRDDFLYLRFDDLAADPASFVRKATDFLGISPCGTVPTEQVNVGLPLVWEGGSLTVRALRGEDRTRPRFDPDEIGALQRRFVPDIRRTEALTGLDLSDWYATPDFAGTPIIDTDGRTV